MRARVRAGVAGGRREALELASSVLEGGAALPGLEDRMAAVVEAAQVMGAAFLWGPGPRVCWGVCGRNTKARVNVCECPHLALTTLSHTHKFPLMRVCSCVCMQVVGMAGSPRRRMLLLWQALDMGRTAPPQPVHTQAGGGANAAASEPRAEALLRIAAAALAPPDDPWTQAPGIMGAVGEAGSRGTHWAHRGSPSMPHHPLLNTSTVAALPSCLPLCFRTPSGPPPGAAYGGLPVAVWGGVRVGVLEMGLWAARQVGAAVDGWEAAAALLR